MGAFMGGGGLSRVGARSSPLENDVFRYLVAFLLLALHVGALFTMWGPFRNFFVLMKRLLWACPTPYKNYCGRP